VAVAQARLRQNLLLLSAAPKQYPVPHWLSAVHASLHCSVTENVNVQACVAALGTTWGTFGATGVVLLSFCVVKKMTTAIPTMSRMMTINARCFLILSIIFYCHVPLNISASTVNDVIEAGSVNGTVNSPAEFFVVVSVKAAPLTRILPFVALDPATERTTLSPE
jgi:hypothetical protein